MFLDSSNYKNAIETLINEEENIDIAVAFWGQGAEKVLNQPGKKFRIICNLASGGTNPSVIEKIRAQSKSIEVKQSDTLHAKIMIGNKSIITGSANISSNGLGLEGDEVAGWDEVGFLCNSSDIIKQASDWFVSRWASAKEISDEDIANAKLQWAKRADTRPIQKKDNDTLLSMPLESMQNRNIYVAIYRDTDTSQEADALFEQAKQAENSLHPDTFYEDWGDSLFEGQIVISIHIGPGGKVSNDGAYEIRGVENFKRNGIEAEVGEIKYGFEVDEVLGMPLSAALDGLDAQVKTHWKNLLPPKQTEPVVKPLFDFLKLIKEQK